MNEMARDRLSELLSSYGSALTNTPQMCGVLIRQQCPDCPEEASLLAHAVQKGTVKELLNLGPTPDWETVSASLAQELSDGTGITTEQAHWAVDSWAMALGKHPTAPQSALEPLPPVYEPITRQDESSTTGATSAIMGGAICGAIGGILGPILNFFLLILLAASLVEVLPEEARLMVWLLLLLVAGAGGFGGAIGGALGIFVCRQFAGTRGAGLFLAWIGGLLGATVLSFVGAKFCGPFGALLGGLVGGWLGAYSSGKANIKGSMSRRW
jgi:hypothetical protein